MADGPVDYYVLPVCLCLWGGGCEAAKGKVNRLIWLNTDLISASMVPDGVSGRWESVQLGRSKRPAPHHLMVVG